MTEIDKKLEHLKSVETPPSSSDAKRRAMALAMEAFDETENNSESFQGTSWPTRLMSIFSPLRRINLMDMRIPVTAAITALLVVPLSWQLMNNTSFTPPRLDNNITLPSSETKSAADKSNVDKSDVELSKGADGLPSVLTATKDETAQLSDETNMPLPEPTVLAEVEQEMAMEETAPVVSGQVRAPQAVSKLATQGASAPPALNNQPVDARGGDQFEAFEDRSIKLTIDQPVSTFSIDVDTASYAYVRNSIESGYLPQKDAVRTEELINYFTYDYAAPASAEKPFAPKITVFPAPWNVEHKLMHVAIRGYMPQNVLEQPTNLVFLIDTSGSMQDADKLPLLKRAFKLLVDQMDDEDTVSIVTYAGAAGVVLEPTKGSQKRKIVEALDRLQPGGSTAGAAGIEAAYRLADEAKNNDGVNRVILATDGDFNVGISDPDALKNFIKQRSDKGISLSVLGFGKGNYNDALMQALAQNGDGNASYIDSFTEARKVLVNEVGSTLQTIARDVKIQMEFNPAKISAYRLIGYETRALNREDFNNDKIDAGDVGASHSVTAIYELTPADGAQPVDPLRYGQDASSSTSSDANANSDEYGYFKMRYKLPNADQSTLIELPVNQSNVAENLSDDIQFGTAVAAFGQKLRDNGYIEGFSFDEIAALAQSSRGADRFGYRAEFIRIVEAAKSLNQN
ncbi:vWA domain-containing protein [Maritalea sp.]|uniref:vWA domain-containing protein n=1 Tax=Maritalea sp. TaxID=2003361 RepID=UPI003EF5F424